MGRLGELILRLFVTGRLSESKIEFEGGRSADGKEVSVIRDGRIFLEGGENAPIRDIRRVWLRGKRKMMR